MCGNGDFEQKSERGGLGSVAENEVNFVQGWFEDLEFLQRGKCIYEKNLMTILKDDL